jgi:type IV pilus assembly protein PilF
MRSVSGLRGLALLLLLAPLWLGLPGCSHTQTKEGENPLGLDAENSPGDLYVAMAAEYYRLGQLEPALRRAEQAVAEDPKNPRAHYMLAVIYQQIGQGQRADDSFKRALELSPKNSDIRNAYGTFHCSQKRYAEADAQFAKALENPLYATPWVAMTNAGICAASAGNPTKAESEYRRALNANPRFGPALIKMAEIDLKRGDAKGAKGYLDRYFQANTPTPYALSLGIQTELKLGNKTGAATYEQVLRKNFPNAPEIHGL